MKLRPYQERAIERVLALFESGVRRVLLVLPTGGGKTVVASEIIRRIGRRTVMLAHRRELVRQAYAKMVENGFAASEVGVIMAGVEWRLLDAIAPDPSTLTVDELWRIWARRRPDAPVQVGSIDTFRGVRKPGAGLVIVDEAHRALAQSYRNVAHEYPDAWHLGLTATPIRADGKGLDEAYDEIVIAATFAELVEEGFLVEPECYGARRKVDLSGVRKTKGDYNQEDLARATDKAELVGDIVEHWLEHGNNAPTFCFAVSVEHSKHLTERFNAAGIPACHVDGSTDPAERDAAIAGLKNGTVKVVCNCNVFTEGTDVPCVKTIILARPTLSESLYLQQAGRGARPFGELPFVILDHAGCCTDPSLRGLPQEPREYSLEARPQRGRSSSSLPPAKGCPNCLAIVPVQTRTCRCGFKFPVEAAVDGGKEPPKEVEGKLEKLNPGQLRRLGLWDSFIQDWRDENARRDREDLPLLEGGAALVKAWRQRERAWPPKGATIPKLTPEEAARSYERKQRTRRARVAQPTFRALEEWL